jgi:hypothetical protein
MPLPSCPARYRERSAEFSGSSHATPAFPPVRIGSSSCGSRRAPECSFPHWEPCRPSLGLGMTPAAGPALRFGEGCAYSYLDYGCLPSRANYSTPSCRTGRTGFSHRAKLVQETGSRLTKLDAYAAHRSGAIRTHHRSAPCNIGTEAVAFAASHCRLT